MMFSKLKLATAAASLLLATFTTTGCHVQSPHPNQINTFDGAAYDTMILAHGALTALRASIATDFPHYAPEFNKAVDTYNAAVVMYSAYRSSSEVEPSVSNALGNLAVSITALEGALVSDLHVDAQRSAQVRKAAQKIRARANAHITIADVLAELEIAASIAAAVPATEGYATLAKVIIDATGAALVAEQAEAGKPIRLDAIAAITPIQQ
ncbi:MAG: hypothetical protein JOZ45_22440 [Acidobacteriaceae bacterium]|nr:hypothetical protein [Acidobacteriaceae bacterium]MBV9308921.1 hypothetical protein [Acidobacteriaceae bacterium]MBV9940178.1 hypothetical protein [Acidobacteriaceae bacterium]